MRTVTLNYKLLKKLFIHWFFISNSVKLWLDFFNAIDFQSKWCKKWALFYIIAILDLTDKFYRCFFYQCTNYNCERYWCIRPLYGRPGGHTQADPEDAKLWRAKEGEGEWQRIEREEWGTRFFLPWSSQWGEERDKSIPAQLATPSPPPSGHFWARREERVGEWEGGGGPASKLTHGPEEGGRGAASQPGHPTRRRGRDSGGRGVTSQVERERGGATPATAETSV